MKTTLIRIGIFTFRVIKHKIKIKMHKDLIDRIAERLDALTSFKNPILEAFDRKVYKITLGYLFGKFWDKIPEDYQDEVIILLNAFADDDYSTLDEEITERISKSIDVPFLSESDEEALIAINIKMILEFILYLKNKS